MSYQASDICSSQETTLHWELIFQRLNFGCQLTLTQAEHHLLDKGESIFHVLGKVQVHGINHPEKDAARGWPVHPSPDFLPRRFPLRMGSAVGFPRQYKGAPLEFECTSPRQLHPKRETDQQKEIIKTVRWHCVVHKNCLQVYFKNPPKKINCTQRKKETKKTHTAHTGRDLAVFPFHFIATAKWVTESISFKTFVASCFQSISVHFVLLINHIDIQIVFSKNVQHLEKKKLACGIQWSKLKWEETICTCTMYNKLIYLTSMFWRTQKDHLPKWLAALEGKDTKHLLAQLSGR